MQAVFINIILWPDFLLYFFHKTTIAYKNRIARRGQAIYQAGSQIYCNTIHPWQHIHSNNRRLLDWDEGAYDRKIARTSYHCGDQAEATPCHHKSSIPTPRNRCTEPNQADKSCPSEYPSSTPFFLSLKLLFYRIKSTKIKFYRKLNSSRSNLEVRIS